MAASAPVFMDSRRLCTDQCAKEARDQQNEQISGYNLYNQLPVQCKDPNARVPTFMYDHVNLHGRPGYGVADDCLIDRYSGLRNDPAQLTRDRCRIQLGTRLFLACPNLKPGMPNPDVEMPLIQGSSSSDLDGLKFPCKKAIAELQTYKPVPLVPCMQDIQDPTHLIMEGPRGGIDTRSYMLRREMLNGCAVPNTGRARAGHT